MIPILLTAKEVAKILKISYDQALYFIKYSGIDYLRIGRQYRVSEEKFYEFINKNGQVQINLPLH